MDDNLRKLERLYRAEGTPEALRVWRMALLRRGLPCGLAVGDTVRIQEHESPEAAYCWLDTPWIGEITALAVPVGDIGNEQYEIPRIVPTETFRFIYVAVRLIEAVGTPTFKRGGSVNFQIEGMRHRGNRGNWVMWPRDEITVLVPA